LPEITPAKKDHKKTESPTNDILQTVLDFCFERTKAWYIEKGISPKVFESVRAVSPSKPLDFDQRMKAVNFFITLPEAETLAAANKRVKNILSKEETLGVNLRILSDQEGNPEPVSLELLKEPAEINLEKALTAKEIEITPFLNARNYTDALKSLAALKEPIDQFFDQVMVMVEDETVRNNRLRLLNRVRNLFIQIADISLLS
jgi:glycyl-tRNA synthetase beta chain